jgi:hypothetical protein
MVLNLLQTVFSLLIPPFRTPQVLAHSIDVANMIMWAGTDHTPTYLRDYGKHLLALFGQVTGHPNVQQQIVKGLSTVLELDPEYLLQSKETFLPLLEVCYAGLLIRDQLVALAACELFAGVFPLCFEQQMCDDEL